MLFDFTIIHIPGVDNIVADALLRVFAMMCQLYSEDDQIDADLLEDLIEIDQQKQFDTTWSEKEVEDFFNRFHNGVTGHLAMAATIKAMRHAGCTAPHLKQQVIRLITQCGPCEKARAIRPKPVLEYHTTSSFKPFEVFQADFLAGIGASEKVYNCVLSFVCTFTRYTMLYSCVDQTASSACNALLHLWGVFGDPRQLTTDGAACFLQARNSTTSANCFGSSKRSPKHTTRAATVLWEGVTPRFRRCPTKFS